jgi:hypothetical protein
VCGTNIIKGLAVVNRVERQPRGSSVSPSGNGGTKKAPDPGGSEAFNQGDTKIILDRSVYVLPGLGQRTFQSILVMCQVVVVVRDGHEEIRMMVEVVDGAYVVKYDDVSAFDLDQVMVECILEDLALKDILIPVTVAFLFSHGIAIHVKRIVHHIGDS